MGLFGGGGGSSKQEVKQNTAQADNASASVNDVVMDDGASMTIVSNTTDHGAIEGAFKLGGAAVKAAQNVAKQNAALAKANVKTIATLGAQVVKSSAATSKEAMKFAGEAIKGNNRLVSQNLEFVQEASSKNMAFVNDTNKKNMDFVESTRVGNQQLAADMVSKALDLAEKRTGSESDQAMTLGTKLLYAAAILGGLFLITRTKKPAK